MSQPASCSCGDEWAQKDEDKTEVVLSILCEMAFVDSFAKALTTNPHDGLFIVKRA